MPVIAATIAPALSVSTRVLGRQLSLRYSHAPSLDFLFPSSVQNAKVSRKKDNDVESRSRSCARFYFLESCGRRRQDLDYIFRVAPCSCIIHLPLQPLTLPRVARQMLAAGNAFHRSRARRIQMCATLIIFHQSALSFHAHSNWARVTTRARRGSPKLHTCLEQSWHAVHHQQTAVLPLYQLGILDGWHLRTPISVSCVWAFLAILAFVLRSLPHFSTVREE